MFNAALKLTCFWYFYNLNVRKEFFRYRMIFGFSFILIVISAFVYILYDTNIFFFLFHPLNFFVHTENASRFCHANGTWDKYVNYAQCNQIDLTHGIDTLPHLEYITHIWFAGYTLSLVSLILGIAIFIHFK